VERLLSVRGGDRDQPHEVAIHDDRRECLALDADSRHELILEARAGAVRPHLRPCAAGGPLEQVRGPGCRDDLADANGVQVGAGGRKDGQAGVGVLEDHGDVDEGLTAHRSGDEGRCRLGGGLDLERPQRGDDRQSRGRFPGPPIVQLAEIQQRFPSIDREVGDGGHNEDDDAHEDRIPKDDAGKAADRGEEMRRFVQHEDRDGRGDGRS